MPHHEERPATALAHGRAKRDDIERVRRDIGTAADAETREPRAGRALGEIEAACQTIRDDVSELKRTMAPARRERPSKETVISGMSGSPAQSPCPRCGQALSTTVSGSGVADQLASERVSCAACGAVLVRVVDGHADHGWQLAAVDA